MLTPSKLVLEAKGVPSIAEASAHCRRRPQCAAARHARRDERWRPAPSPSETAGDDVHFIGAGPGAPDLITVRGRDLIASCPVCLYAGSLVPKALLDHCPPGARIVDTAPMSLDEIVEECKRATAARPRRGAAAFGRPLDLERAWASSFGASMRRALPTP